MTEPKPRPDGLDSPIVKPIMRAFSKVNVWVYRATGGRLGNRWHVGAAWKKPAVVCLLTTTGRKSGVRRTTPLIFLADGERVVLVASMGGMPKNPLWYDNLVADPNVEVQIGSVTRPMRARTASPEERAALWPRLVELYADYDQYQAWTERQIPVVVCEPA